MNTVINVLYFWLAWIFGYLVGCFVVVNSIIIIRFGIPLTVRLNNKRVMNSYAPVKKYIASFLFLSFILAISTTLVFTFFSNYKFPYILGITISFLIGNRATGFNKNNLSDFLEANAKYLTISFDKLDEKAVKYFFNPNPRNASSMVGSEILARVVGESMGNVIFFGLITLVIFFIGKLSWWIGVIFFFPFAILLLIGFLDFIFKSGIEIIRLIGNIYRKLKGERSFTKEESFLNSASFVQAVETMVYILYFFYLYRVFF